MTPDQTWLINEMVNNVRRVYTDGRPHTADEDAYATWNGDTVGFWDGGTLTTHTKHLFAGQYQRGVQPNYWTRSRRSSVHARRQDTGRSTCRFTIRSISRSPGSPARATRSCRTTTSSCGSAIGTAAKTATTTSSRRRTAPAAFPDFNFVENDAAASSDQDVKKAAGAKK